MAKSVPFAEKVPSKAKSLGQSLGETPEVAENPMDDYETQGHLKTLMEAHGIMNDPDKMKKVHALAGAHVAAIKGIKNVPVPAQPVRSVQDLKNAKNKAFAPGGQDNLGKLAGSSEDDDQDGE
jgi:hypothetical protein